MLQLAMIRGSEGPGALLELRYRRPHGTVRRDGFYDAHDAERVSAEIDRLAAHGDVWVGTAPRTCHDGTAAGVAQVWCLWADLDGPEALARLAAFHAPPSIVIESGSEHCAHGWWALRRPLRATDAQRACRRLALALGGDMAATDPARIMRVAGTLNWKHNPPREVRCTRLELDSYDARELVGDLPDSHHYAPARRRHAPIRSDPGRVLSGLASLVRTAEVGNRNHALFWAACRVVDHASAGELDESEAFEELRAAALDAGLAEHEISATIASASRTPQRAAA